MYCIGGWLAGWLCGCVAGWVAVQQPPFPPSPLWGWDNSGYLDFPKISVGGSSPPAPVDKHIPGRTRDATGSCCGPGATAADFIDWHMGRLVLQNAVLVLHTRGMSGPKRRLSRPSQPEFDQSVPNPQLTTQICGIAFGIGCSGRSLPLSAKYS